MGWNYWTPKKANILIKDISALPSIKGYAVCDLWDVYNGVLWVGGLDLSDVVKKRTRTNRLTKIIRKAVFPVDGFGFHEIPVASADSFKSFRAHSCNILSNWVREIKSYETKDLNK